MDDLEDFLDFADEDEAIEGCREDLAPWKIIIVDDEVSIHDVTTLALKNFEFSGRQLHFIHCYSGAEALEAVKEHPDAAVMLLDVVMETDHAGLDTARKIRNELKNNFLRIILRTGQPGQAPERRVIIDYDINDYKEKTELTSQKLFTTMYSSLRSYRDITTISAHKVGLERVIKASADLFELTTFHDFANGVLDQLTALLRADPGSAFLQTHGLAISLDEINGIQVVAGSGQFSEYIGSPLEAMPQEVATKLKEVLGYKKSKLEGHEFVGYFESKSGTVNVLYISADQDIDVVDADLIEVFTSNLAIAFDNANLHKDILVTQQEIVYILGEAVEARSNETGSHVKRVAQICKILGKGYGLPSDQLDLLTLASPLHDIGKIGIPDIVLNKPGKLNPAEWSKMQEHAQIGFDMLKNSTRPILKAASTIALEHHEKWDGSGYPDGKVKDETDILSRIVGLADVYDALGSKRSYKEPWTESDIVKLINDSKGSHFDPDLVDVFNKNLKKLASVREKLPD